MATTASSSLLAALSASGSHVAVVVPSSVNNASLLRIQVFQTQSGTLQTTLVHRSNNSTTAAAGVAGAAAAASSSTPMEIFWADDDKICVLTTLPQQVLVFDLTRGVLAHTIPAAAANNKKHAGGDQIVLHHAAAAAPATYNGANSVIQVLVSSSASHESGGGKIQIHEYDAASGKLLRKIKAGSRHHNVNDDVSKNTAASLGLAVTKEYLIVREANQLRILKAETGEKVTKKCKLFSNKKHVGNYNTTTVDATVAAGQLGAAVVSAARQVVLVNLKTGKFLQSLPCQFYSSSSSLNNANGRLQLWQTAASEQSSSLYHLYHDKVLYNLELSSSDGNKEFKVKSKRKIQINSSIEKQALLLGGGSSHNGNGDDMLIAILYKAGQIQLLKVSLVSSSSSSSSDDVVAITWNDPESADNITAAASSTKRKSSPTIGTQILLGPGQAGGEARSISESGGSAPKRAKKEAGDDDNDDKKEGDKNVDGETENDDDDEDNQGPTIAERLQKLEQALNAEQEQDDEEKAREGKNSTSSAIKFHPKKATTESLTLVLEQALQSNDKAMLELALSVTNQRILQATCESLSTESLIQLLSALTTRLAQKPARAVQLSCWLTVVLKSERIVQNKSNNIGQLLQPLRNLLEERVELFPTFYKLRGRLGMMGNLQE